MDNLDLITLDIKSLQAESLIFGNQVRDTYIDESFNEFNNDVLSTTRIMCHV